MDRLTNLGFGALGMALLLALYLGGTWTLARYREFVVMRLVVVSFACGNPTEAAKIGIVCPAPQQPGPPVAPGNATPVAPARPSP